MSRSVCWTPHAWDDYLHWQSQDRRTLKRIHALIADCQRHPHEGIGKPEPLSGSLAGFWSRRIDDTHRLVYDADKGKIRIIQCRYHYSNR